MKKAIVITLAALAPALLCSPSVALAQQNAVTHWHSNAQTLVASFTGRGNAAQAYTMALIQVAVYDASVAVRGAGLKGARSAKPFIADIVAPVGADLNAAIATAAFRVGYERVNSNPTARSNYWNAYTAYLAAIPAGQAKTDGIAVGEATAKRSSAHGRRTISTTRPCTRTRRRSRASGSRSRRPRHTPPPARTTMRWHSRCR